MSEHAPDDAAAVRRELADLRAAYQRLQEASTAREKEEAREDVAEAKEDLDEIARKAGVSRGAIEKAIADAKRAERKEELRPIMEELLSELVADDEDEEPAAEEEPEAKAKPAVEKPKAPPPDSGPVVPHWSERGISELLR